MSKVELQLRRCAALVAMLLLSSTAAAQERAPATTGPPPPADATPATDENLCGPPSASTAFIDWLHSGLFRLTCGSVSWLDGLFGDRRYDREYRATHGTVTTGALWSERDRWNEVLRIRVRVYFPQVSQRFHAFLGREDRDEYLAEEATELHGLPTQFNRNADESVFLGLGYNEPLRKHGSFDFDTGVKVRFPLNPYVKGSYRFAQKLSESDLFRFRQIVFWEHDERLGTATHIDLDHVMGSRHLLRWSGSGTFSENTEGLRWYSNIALFHLMSEARAFSYEVAADGSTDREVPLSSYGFTTVYRQRLFRQWFTMDLRAGINWPRYALAEERRSNLNASVAFELRFDKD